MLSCLQVTFECVLIQFCFDVKSNDFSFSFNVYHMIFPFDSQTVPTLSSVKYFLLMWVCFLNGNLNRKVKRADYNL